MKLISHFAIVLGMFAVLSFSQGCQTSHTETDKTGLLGGHTHEETTTTKNPITGDTNTSTSDKKTN